MQPYCLSWYLWPSLKSCFRSSMSFDVCVCSLTSQVEEVFMKQKERPSVTEINRVYRVYEMVRQTKCQKMEVPLKWINFNKIFWTGTRMCYYTLSISVAFPWFGTFSIHPFLWHLVGKSIPWTLPLLCLPAVVFQCLLPCVYTISMFRSSAWYQMSKGCSGGVFPIVWNVADIAGCLGIYKVVSGCVFLTCFTKLYSHVCDC